MSTDLTIKIDSNTQFDLLRAASAAAGFLSVAILPEKYRESADRIAADLRAAIDLALAAQKVAA